MFRRSIAALLVALSPAAAAQAAPALWAVKDADTTIYLFGTIHALPKETQWFDGAIRQAFDKSDTVILETLAPRNEAELAPVVMSLGFSAGQPPLADRVAPTERPRLDKAAREAGLSPASLNAMETWLATVTLSAQQLSKLGLDPKLGVEKMLTAKAEAAGKKLVGLETVAQQMGFLDTLPEADQRAYLSATLKEWPAMKAKLGELVGYWTAGNVEALGKAMNEDVSETPKLTKVLLSDRNARWADWIRNRMAQPGTVFLAVGAGHLAGPDSVQTILSKRGLKAERLS